MAKTLGNIAGFPENSERESKDIINYPPENESKDMGNLLILSMAAGVFGMVAKLLYKTTDYLN